MNKVVLEVIIKKSNCHSTFLALDPIGHKLLDF